MPSSDHKPWKYPYPMTRDDWRVEPRTNESGYRAWYLQHREADGTWTDFSGPYRATTGARDRFHRMEFYWLQDVRRDPTHVHTWDGEPGTPFRRCTVCRLYEDSIKRESQG